MSKLFIIGGLVVIFVIGGWYLFGAKQSSKKDTMMPASEQKKPVAFTPQLEAVLKKKIEVLEELVKDPVIVEDAVASTAKNKSLSTTEIDRLDKTWRAVDGVDAFIKPFLTNRTAIVLLAFQEKNSGFTEIFVADGVGLNVGQTNKTSDYYQADEDWWVKGFAGGKGLSYWGEIEYDESAQTEAIPLYVPIMEVDGSAIGVLKAILDVNSIKSEL